MRSTSRRLFCLLLWWCHCPWLRFESALWGQCIGVCTIPRGCARVRQVHSSPFSPHVLPCGTLYQGTSHPTAAGLCCRLSARQLMSSHLVSKFKLFRMWVQSRAGCERCNWGLSSVLWQIDLLTFPFELHRRRETE